MSAPEEFANELGAEIAETETTQDVDRRSRHLWHTSQHNHMPIFLGGRLQEQANKMREAVGLEPLGWGDAIPDAEFGECSVHSDGCAGQETHADLRTPPGQTTSPTERPGGGG